MPLADGAHLAYEIGANDGKSWALTSRKDKNGKTIPVYKAMEDNVGFEIIEWVAPLLCLPDLALNGPKAFREASQLRKELNEANKGLQEGGETVGKLTDRLHNYVEKRAATPSNPAKQSTVDRYQRAINAAKKEISYLKTKHAAALTKAIAGGIRAGFTAIGYPTSAYGLGTMVISPPHHEGFSGVGDAIHNVSQRISQGWHDMGAWFTPAAMPDYPVMPDADERTYHPGFRGGYSTRIGDDPWNDMKNYLSMHLAITRIKSQRGR